MKCAAFAIILAILLTDRISKGAKILFLLPISYKSHVNIMEPLIKALGERGHDILTISPVTLSKMPENVKQVKLFDVDDIFFNMTSPIEIRRRGFLGRFFYMEMEDRISRGCANVLTHPYLQNELLINADVKFDLVIVDIVMNHCVLGLLPYFKAPSIFVGVNAAIPSHISNVVGNRLPTSFVPSVMLQFSEKMTFFERMINTVVEFSFNIGIEHVLVSRGESIFRTYLPDGHSLPSIDEIRENVSMIFVNSHIALNSPRPLLPNVIEIGGMHTTPAGKLPQDLDEFMNGAGADGVILFSMGSVVKTTEMPEDARKIFVGVFSKLKQRVLWKWDTEVMPDVPSNVLLRNWLPQQNILGHPNLKLFLNHGGLLSLQEAAYHGVPVIGMPVTGDTDFNIKQAEYAGYARIVEFGDLNEDVLEQAIVEMLTDTRYKEKAKELSKLMRDVPASSLDKAVFWTEYVIRHKGAPHLSSAAKDLNFFQYYLFDVAVVLLGGSFLTFYVIIRCCRKVSRKL